MKITNLQLLQINDALTYLSDSNTEAWYQVGKNLRKIKTPIVEFRASHQDIVENYAEKDKNGQIQFINESNTEINFGKNGEKATELWNNLMNEEIDIDFHKINYKKIGDASLDALRVEPLLDIIITENGEK